MQGCLVCESKPLVRLRFLSKIQGRCLQVAAKVQVPGSAYSETFMCLAPTIANENVTHAFQQRKRIGAEHRLTSVSGSLAGRRGVSWLLGFGINRGSGDNTRLGKEKKST